MHRIATSMARKKEKTQKGRSKAAVQRRGKPKRQGRAPPPLQKKEMKTHRPLRDATGGGRKFGFAYWTVEFDAVLGITLGVASVSGIGISGSLDAEICGTLTVLSRRARIPVCSGRFTSLPLRAAT